jgi:hypothetical protein
VSEKEEQETEINLDAVNMGPPNECLHTLPCELTAERELRNSGILEKRMLRDDWSDGYEFAQENAAVIPATRGGDLLNLVIY